MSNKFRPYHQCAVLPIVAILLFNFLSVDTYAEKSNSFRIAASDSLTQPIIISVKGGISKGSYQAGLNWGLLRFFKHVNSEFSNPSAGGLYKNQYGQKLKFDLSVYVGSSAGNINGLTSAIEWCRDDFLSRDPEESLFWNVWTPVGINQLFLHEKADNRPRAVFTRKYFDEILFKTIQSYTKNQNLIDNCSVALGITLTRQQPQKISIGDATDNLLIDSQRSVSIFEASVDTKSGSKKRLIFGHHPSTTADNPFNTNPDEYGQLVLPPFSSNEEENDFSVFKITEASSAFPLFFGPVELEYYDHRGMDEPSLLKTANFLDGGVFDNNPLSLGLKLYEYEKRRRDYKRPATLIYLDPNNRRDSTDDIFQDERVDFGIGALTGFLGGFISSARQYELEVFARDKDALSDLNLSITSNRFTMISEHLKSFGAFLGRPFREYDFYVGIYDALHFVSKNYLCKDTSDTCLSENISELAHTLQLDQPTKIYIAHLLGDEFGKQSIQPIIRDSIIAPSSNEKIITYLLKANSAFLRQNGDIDYSVDDFIEFMETLRSFDDGEFLKLIKKEAQVCKNLRRDYPERLKYRVDCYVDPFLIDIIQSPDHSMYELAEQFAYKLWRVEQETGETNFEKIPEFSQYFLIHSHVHRQTGINWSNTIPRRNWKRNKSRQKTLTFLTEWFFPYEIQTSVSTGIMSFRYNTLQYRINKNFSIQMPATLFESYRKDETYFGVGIGGKLHTNNTLLGLDARVNYQHKWKSPFDFNEQLVGGEIGFILGTKVRFAIQNKTLFSGHSKLNNRTFFTVGIVDLNGILYWLVRTSR